MAIYCDHCVYYKDDSENTGGNFEGEGLCMKKKNIRVDACYDCHDDFHCILADCGLED